jgi:hypothetical protein
MLSIKAEMLVTPKGLGIVTVVWLPDGDDGIDEPLLSLTVPVQHILVAEPVHKQDCVATEHSCVVVSIQVPLHPLSLAGVTHAAIVTPLKTGKIIIEIIAMLNIFVFII